MIFHEVLINEINVYNFLYLFKINKPLKLIRDLNSARFLAHEITSLLIFPLCWSAASSFVPCQKNVALNTFQNTLFMLFLSYPIFLTNFFLYGLASYVKDQ